MLKMVNLTDKAKRQVRSLSGGQKQRLSLASALGDDPRSSFWTSRRPASIPRRGATRGTSSARSASTATRPS